jgi:hypothetical protein
MEKDDDTPVKDSVPTEAEETKPTSDAPLVVTPPSDADSSVRDSLNALNAKVEELSGIVTGILASGGGEKDSTPSGRPWTHWGKGKR